MESHETNKSNFVKINTSYLIPNYFVNFFSFHSIFTMEVSNIQIRIKQLRADCKDGIKFTNKERL